MYAGGSPELEDCFLSDVEETSSDGVDSSANALVRVKKRQRKPNGTREMWLKYEFENVVRSVVGGQRRLGTKYIFERTKILNQNSL